MDTAAEALVDVARTSGSVDDGRSQIEPFWGPHQGGITTLMQSHTYAAALDLISTKREDVIRLLRAWTSAAARMSCGQTAQATGRDVAQPAPDSGEALGLPAARLTLSSGGRSRPPFGAVPRGGGKRPSVQSQNGLRRPEPDPEPPSPKRRRGRDRPACRIPCARRGMAHRVRPRPLRTPRGSGEYRAVAAAAIPVAACQARSSRWRAVRCPLRASSNG
jgi:Dyp-type peroxidase, N-terminal